jgi:hypothetical protein
MAARFCNRRCASRCSRPRVPWRAPDVIAFAFLKTASQVSSSFVVAPKYAWRGRGLRARNKKPDAVSRPGGWRSFDEYAFLEDSRYTSQEESEMNLIVAA